jgi:hypothetical protein
MAPNAVKSQLENKTVFIFPAHFLKHLSFSFLLSPWGFSAPLQGSSSSSDPGITDLKELQS